MNRISGIVLVGLLGFLGCSDGNDGTSTFNGEATPVSPFGIIETPSPTYEWTPVPSATKYRLLVENTNQDSTTQDTTETYIIDEWYTAEEAECASEDGLCIVTPDTEVIGENAWKVQACANQECGLWSEQLNFDFTAMNGPRFTDNGDDTVTDNNTKLMWSKNANLSGTMDWQEAGSYCAGLTHADHSDWRLPSLSELKSLIDKNQYDPALPPGNPFMNVQSFYYWSRTTWEPRPDFAWVVHMAGGHVEYGYVSVGTKNYYYCVWAVRSGN